MSCPHNVQWEDECKSCKMHELEELIAVLNCEIDSIKDENADLQRRIRDALVVHVDARLEGIYIGGLQSIQPGKYALVRLKDDEL